MADRKIVAEELRSSDSPSVAMLRATLEWYANPLNWVVDGDVAKPRAMVDRGTRARAALVMVKP